MHTRSGSRLKTVARKAQLKNKTGHHCPVWIGSQGLSRPGVQDGKSVLNRQCERSPRRNRTRIGRHRSTFWSCCIRGIGRCTRQQDDRERRLAACAIPFLARVSLQKITGYRPVYQCQTIREVTEHSVPHAYSWLRSPWRRVRVLSGIF